MKRLIGIILMLCCLCSPLYAADYYVAQTAAGSGNGSSCGNADAIADLTWGAGNMVAAGDTLHVCGTITSTLSVGASGSSGSEITIKFETGAKFSKTAWGTASAAAIYIDNKDYIIVDGDDVGIIESTDNGTGLGTQQDAHGISVTRGSDYVTIKNLDFRNIYDGNSVDGGTVDSNTYGSAIYAYANNYLTIENNTITNGGKTILVIVYGTNSHLAIHDNTISDVVVAITVGTGGTSATLDTADVYNNHITLGTNWSGCWGTCATSNEHHHTDGIHVYASHADSAIADISIYNNIIGGTNSYYTNPDNDVVSNVSAFIYPNGGPGVLSGLKLYNNVLYTDAGYTGAADANIYIRMSASPKLYNNTIISPTGNINNGIMMYESTTNADLKNNIIYKTKTALNLDSTSSLASTSNSNVYYDNAWDFYLVGTGFITLEDLQTLYSSDSNSVRTDPQLDASHKPTESSTNLIDHGVSCSADFTTDADGNTRTGTWDIGAYEYTEGVTTHTFTVAKSGTGATMTTGAQTVEEGAAYSISVTRHNGWNGAWSTSDGANCVVSGCSVPNQGATGTCSVTVNADCTVTYTATQIQVIW